MSTQAVTPQVQQMLGDATMKFAFRDFHAATALLLEVVRVAPGLPHPYQTLGLIYEEMEQPKKALKLYTMAAQLSQRDAQQWRHLASLATRENEIAQVARGPAHPCALPAHPCARCRHAACRRGEGGRSGETVASRACARRSTRSAA